MTRLANNALRTKNLSALLKDMGIGNAVVNCNDELVVLKPTNSAEAGDLAEEIQALLQTETTKPVVTQLSLNELLTAEINAAACTNVPMTEKNKRSLKALLPILDLDFMLDEQQEYLDIELPEEYVPIFRSLTYKYMTLKKDETTLRFNLKAFLKDHRDELVLIDGKAPVLLCDAAQFESKKVFYAQKPAGQDEVEVTPHVFIPRATKPPVYTFVVDTSGSMSTKYIAKDETTRLAKLKESAIKFAQAIWEFHPDAVINIKQFSNAASNVGSYKKDDLASLRFNVNRLEATGGTALYAATAQQLSSLASTGHTNVLLFTDGDNTEPGEQQLKENLESIANGSPLTPARNKFFIISYGATQPQILQDVAKIFSSPVIYTNSPDFVAALSESNKMQEWAAARELFTCRLDITAGNSSSREVTYTCSYDLSGQFTALKPILCKADEALRLKITDGDSQVMLDDRKPAVKPAIAIVEQQSPVEATPVLPGSAKTATQIGVFGVGTQPQPPVTKTHDTDPTVIFNT